MCKLFDEWKAEIKRYCDQNGLSFDAAQKLSQAWNATTVVLYHPEKDNSESGLLNDTPSPMVLLIQREKDGTLKFEQTEHTKKYLGTAS